MNEARPYASLSSGLLARKGTAKPAMRPQGYGGLEDLGWNDMGHGAEPGRNIAPPEHVPSSIAALTPAPKHGRPATSDEDIYDEELEEAAEAEAVDRAEPVEAIEEPDHFEAIEESEPFQAVQDGEQDEAAHDEAGEGYDVHEAYGEAAEQAAPIYEDPAPVEAHEAADEAPAAEAFEAPSVVAQQRAILERFDGEEDVAPQLRADPAPVVPLPQRHAEGEGRKAAFTLRLDSDRHLRLRLACAVSGRSAQQIVARALDQALASIPEIEALASQVPAKPGRAGAKRN